MMPQPSPDLYAGVKGLRAVRSYEPRPLEPDDLEAILEAGRWTGSAKNTQRWVLRVLEDKADLERLATAGNSAGPVTGAAAVIALVRLPEAYEFDIGRLAQNLMLAAAARGVGSCPITLHRGEVAAEVLGLAAGQECRYAITLGYPDPEGEKALRARRSYGGRKPASEVVRRGGLES